MGNSNEASPVSRPHGSGSRISAFSDTGLLSSIPSHEKTPDDSAWCTSHIQRIVRSLYPSEKQSKE